MRWLITHVNWTDDSMVRIFKHYIPFSLVLVGLLEASVFFAAVPLAKYLNKYDANHFSNFFYTEFVFMLVVILSMAAAGLYSRHLRENFRGVIFRVILVLTIVFFVPLSQVIILPNIVMVISIQVYDFVWKTFNMRTNKCL